jgi:hypothetical protein
VKQIRVRIGKEEEVFLLRKELLTSRAEAIRCMKRLQALALQHLQVGAETQEANQADGGTIAFPLPIVAQEGPMQGINQDLSSVVAESPLQEIEDAFTFDEWMDFS